MKSKRKIAATIILLFTAAGCAIVSEPFKVIWGSSTRALEQARDEALTKTYSCDFDACYDAVLKIAKEARYEIFINERRQEYIVVMGIHGNVNTTEVGIFFSKVVLPVPKIVEENETILGTPEKFPVKIEVASLSSTAKEKVAKVIFEGLDKKFAEQK